MSHSVGLSSSTTARQANHHHNAPPSRPRAGGGLHSGKQIRITIDAAEPSPRSPAKSSSNSAAGNNQFCQSPSHRSRGEDDGVVCRVELLDAPFNAAHSRPGRRSRTSPPRLDKSEERSQDGTAHSKLRVRTGTPDVQPRTIDAITGSATDETLLDRRRALPRGCAGLATPQPEHRTAQPYDPA